MIVLDLSCCTAPDAAHAVSELHDAVARAHASHATCEAQLAEAATRSANARGTARSERGEAVAELAASWETVARPQVIPVGVRVASVNAHVEALLALTARHNMHIAECKRLVRTDTCALYDVQATKNVLRLLRAAAEQRSRHRKIYFNE